VVLAFLAVLDERGPTGTLLEPPVRLGSPGGRARAGTGRRIRRG
jgi:hypothetical protein